MKAEKQSVSRLLKTARGQIDGILKMIDEDRYCIDISNQLLAAESLLRKTNKAVLSAHMKHCVQEAVEHGNSDEKIDEIIALINKMS